MPPVQDIIETFRAYLDAHPDFSDEDIRLCVATVRQFVEFLKITHNTDDISRFLTNRSEAADFIKTLTSTTPNAERRLKDRKQDELKVFQDYLSGHREGRVSLWITRLEEFLRRPSSRLIARLVGVIALIVLLVQLCQYLDQGVNVARTVFFATQTPPPTPTYTPTKTHTPTVTPTPTQTSTYMPTYTPVPTVSPTFAFADPISSLELSTFTRVIYGYVLAGDSKQTGFVRDSRGILTFFVLSDTGDLAYIQSKGEGQPSSQPIVIDSMGPPGSLRVSTAIDRSDRIHVLWGRVPEPQNTTNYGVIELGILAQESPIATGMFAHDITVDSTNNAHAVWTVTDLLYARFDGRTWGAPRPIAEGIWHPDIQLDEQDNVYIFANDGGFYPRLGISVVVISDASGIWQRRQISTSPFWSGGAAAAIGTDGVIYLLWIGSSTEGGGLDQVFFSRYIGGNWQDPFVIGDLNTSAGSTGQESPAVGVDTNNVLYVAWRGLNDRGRPVIYVRVFVPSNVSIPSVISGGWFPVITLDDPDAVDVGWPSIADVRPAHRGEGIDIAWSVNTGGATAINYTHLSFPYSDIP